MEEQNNAQYEPQQPQAPQYQAPQQPQAPQYQAPQQPYQPQYQPYQPQPQYHVAPTQTNGLGIAGFVLSLVGLVLFWVPFLDVIAPLIGIVLSAFGMKHKPNGLAIAGLVIGIVALIIGAIITIGVLVAVDKATDIVRYNNLNW